MFLHCHAVLFEGALLRIKINTISNVVCTQIVPHCSTNRGCGINQGNMVVSKYIR